MEIAGKDDFEKYNTGGTDHLPFVALGLPGFQFVQDPVDYDTRTHHTHLDVFEAALEDDLKQASAILASVVYHAAMREEMFPARLRRPGEVDEPEAGLVALAAAPEVDLSRVGRVRK